MSSCSRIEGQSDLSWLGRLKRIAEYMRVLQVRRAPPDTVILVGLRWNDMGKVVSTVSQGK